MVDYFVIQMSIVRGLVPLNMCLVCILFIFCITCIFDAIGIMNYVLAMYLIRAMNFDHKVSKNKSGP